MPGGGLRIDETSSRPAHALTGHTLHLMVSSFDGSSQPLESRSNRRLFDIWHIQIILGEELDESGGDGGGIPARQVVARTWYRHRVDFWNPLLQSIGALKEYRQCIAAAHRQHRVSNIFQALGCDIPVLHGSEFDLKVRVDIGYRAVERTRRQGAVGESPVVLSVRACQDDVHGRSFVS